jgi:hypothetical protein
MRAPIFALLLTILTGLVFASENRQGNHPKEPGANTTPHPADRKPAVAAASSLQTYKSNDLGFSFSYPVDWFIFEHVNTFYIERGLPKVFNLCLTRRPPKGELACDIEFYVIPEEQFRAPTTVKSTFLGLAVAQPDIHIDPRFGSVAGKLFAVTDLATPTPELIYNHYVAQNGFVYLWVYSGSRGGRPNTLDASGKMLSSFRFFPPVK